MSKSITKRENILLLFLCIAILSEIFLLDQNFKLKKILSDHYYLKPLLSQAQNNIDFLNYLNRFEGRCLPSVLNEIFSSNSYSYLNLKKPKVVILFYFLLDDCANCQIEEISTWNRFHTLCEQKNCQVIGLTDTTGYGNLKSIAKSLNIHFPLFHVADMNNQLNNLGITSTPITFLVDLTMNKIIYANASLPYNESGSEEFSKKLQMMLDECE